MTSESVEQRDLVRNGEQLQIDLAKVLTADGIVVDVGANEGEFIEAILEIQPDKKIIAFEPAPSARRALDRRYSCNKNVIVRETAIGSVTGVAQFYVTESNVGSSLLKPIPGQSSKWLNVVESILVEVQTLEDAIASELSGQSNPIDLIKIDAQGSDYDVLRSAGQFLKDGTVRSFLVEVNFAEFYERQGGYVDIFNLMSQEGFQPGRIYPYRRRDGWLWWADVLFLHGSLR
jgi:FkbM family methyltransferase